MTNTQKTHNSHSGRNRLLAFLLALTLLEHGWFRLLLLWLAYPARPRPLPLLATLSGGYAVKPFKFVVATDSHVGSGQGNRNSSLAFDDMALRHSDAAFLIHMGDITETGAGEE